MKISVGPNRVIELAQGDITRETTHAIVNAANSELLPGGGVCGAIHRAGGPTIAEECATIRANQGPVPPGGVAATKAGQLQAKYVIHAVGPVYQGGVRGEADVLASCYRESLRAADGLGLESISFPAISTGIFGYPVPEAAKVALTAVADELPKLRFLQTVRFILFDRPTLEAFAAAARQTLGSV